MSTATDQSDLALLRDSARDFLAAEAPVARLRRVRDFPEGMERSLWNAMAELGWAGTLVPEDLGGLGLGLPELAILGEECGRTLVTEPLTDVAGGVARLLVRLADSGATRELLDGLMSGCILPVLAWQGSLREPFDRLFDVVCAPRGNGIELTGIIQCVPLAEAADGFLVPATSPDGPAVVWVERARPGLEVARHALADGTHQSTLSFHGCALGRDALLAAGPPVAQALREALDCGAALAAAYLCGVMDGALERTLDYLRVRHQFGRPIGSFQALQHRAVDLYVQRRISGAVVADAVRSFAVARDADERAALASRAKARASEAALFVTRQAIQCHGAIGYTDEHDIGLFLKRAMVVAASWGTAGQHRRRLTSQLESAAREAPALPAVEVPAPGATMDWNALPDDTFRAMVRAWFTRELPAALRHPARRPRWAEVRGWYLTLSAQGWLAPAWPREHGGMGLDPGKLLIFIEEQEAQGAPRMPDMGVVMIGPLLIKHGSAAQRRRYLPKILNGENVWCQGYSEPDAGSDLASLRTEAVAVGDGFVINGQKTWTSLAHDATHIFLLARTDKTVKKQRGISFILVDMKTPGITVRPIINLAGHAEFCEVFFDNVRVPADSLVGELNQGWSIAKALLGFERIFLGSPKLCQYALHRLREFALADGLLEDAGFADRFARLALDVQDLESAYAEFAAVLAAGGTIGADVSILKIWATETQQRLTELFVEAAGNRGAQTGPLVAGGQEFNVLSLFYLARPATIYGGSNEIQRNIVAQQVLNLPG